jgi:GT2 family glycosyltransferase
MTIAMTRENAISTTGISGRLIIGNSVRSQPDVAATIADVSIIVVNYNTLDLLRNCLVSLCDSEAAASEIIVVDNASSDGSPEMVQHQFPAIRLLRNTDNVGFATANNQAIRHAKGKYILMLNSDTVTHRGAIQGMMECLASNTGIGAVTCKLLNGDGSIQASISSRPGPVLLLFRQLGISRLIAGDRLRRLLATIGFALGRTIRGYLAPYSCSSTPFAIENASGACLMIRRNVLDDIGLLDERFFMYFEDMDLCLRIRTAGWQIVYVPQGEITHFVGKSSGGRMRSHSVHSYRSLFAFYQKHFSKAYCFVVRCMVLADSTVRWTFNYTLGVLCRKPIYKRNAIDLREVMRICSWW